MKNFLAFVVGMALVVGVAAGVFYAAAPAAGAGRASPAAVAAAPVERQFYPVMLMSGGRSAEIHRWSPGALIANVGDTITLKILNGDVDCVEDPHGFAIAGYGIDIPEIPAGESETVTFVADKPGIFNFACARDDCAEDHGEQVGQLIVLG